MKPWPAAMFALLVATPTVAAAQAPRVELHWAPDASLEGCPDAAEVQGEIEAMLPRGGASADAVVVHAHVTPAPAGLRLELWAQRGSHAGRRELVAASCEPLVEAVALIVALLVAPESDEAPAPVAADAREEARASTDGEPEPPPANPYRIEEITSFDSGWLAGDDEVLPNPFRDPEGGPELRAAVGIEAGLNVGALPDPSAVLGARVDLCVDDHCPWLGATFFLPSSVDVAPGSQGVVDFWLFATRFGYRHRSHRSWWEVGPIASLDVGMVNVSSHDVAAPASAQAAWLALSAGAFFGGGGDRLRVRLEVEAQIPLLRPEYVVEGAGAVFRSDPITLLVSLVLEMGGR